MPSSRYLHIRRASAGSGKTYTLAAHYIALLMHGESYRSILAVTFTNKATAEMKERILGYLYAMARHIDRADTQRFVHRVREIAAELGYDVSMLTDAVLQQRAEAVYASILSHYDEMRVQTIDTFLQSLLAGMVQQLNGAVGYQIELDVNNIVSSAVDQLLTQGARQPDICRALTAYMDQMLSQDKSWDIRSGLNDIGKELFKEFLQEHVHQLVFSPSRLQAFQTQVSDWRTTAAADIAALQQALTRAGRFTAKDFNRGQQSYIDVLTRLQASVDGTIEDSKLFVSFTDNTLRKLNDADQFASVYKGGESAEAVRNELLTVHDLSQRCLGARLHAQYVTRFLNDMVLMGALLDSINAHLSDTNSRLLATTANTLAQALAPGDADFILEKAGIRYRHIMLDEFQDTSDLQWANFEKLLHNILSEGGSTLIVGDIKQSIYRWRNGNWEIMADLPQRWSQFYNADTPALQRNFRSERAVVEFNLATFNYLAEREPLHADLYLEGYDGTNLSTFYRPDHNGGYVQLHCYTQTSDRKQSELRRQVRTNILLDVFSAIEHLLQRGVLPQDILILFRNNKEAKVLLDTLHEATALEGHPYPLLAQTNFVSNSCFQLQYSQSVNLLVAAVRYVYLSDQPSLLFVHQFVPALDLAAHQALCRQMALTDLVEWLIQQCILLPGLAIKDLSYINSFRDSVRNYVAQHGSNGVAFLRHWDDRLSTTAIPAVDIAGIRLMTIHTSKGLEGKNVFLPFADWEMEEDKLGSKLWCEVPELTTDDGSSALLPIPQDSRTSSAGFANAYTREHELQRVDNLNLLYVALTRAAERLFIYTDVAKRDDNRMKWHVGLLLAERCGLLDGLDQLLAENRIGGEQDYVSCTFGDAQWMAPPSSQSVDTNPMSFQSAEPLDAHCYSSDARIEFRQSQDSRKYGWDIATQPERMDELEQSALGTICHDILSSIRTCPTTEAAVRAVRLAVDMAYNRGIIPSDAVRQRILPLLIDTVSSPVIKDWFTGSWYLQCEEAILLKDEHGELEERRMDRVMWTTDRKRAIVLDYKFGHDDPKYDRQVRRYMDICRRMGAAEVQGYLWIAAERRLQSVSNS